MGQKQRMSEEKWSSIRGRFKDSSVLERVFEKTKNKTRIPNLTKTEYVIARCLDCFNRKRPDHEVINILQKELDEAGYDKSIKYNVYYKPYELGADVDRKYKQCRFHHMRLQLNNNELRGSVKKVQRILEYSQQATLDRMLKVRHIRFSELTILNVYCHVAGGNEEEAVEILRGLLKL